VLESCFSMRGHSQNLEKELLIFVKFVEEAYWTHFVFAHWDVRLAFSLILIFMNLSVASYIYQINQSACV
jgi:outer membrane receptor for monomeric catechols